MSWTNDKTGWLLALGGAVAGFAAVRFAARTSPVSNPEIDSPQHWVDGYAITIKKNVAKDWSQVFAATPTHSYGWIGDIRRLGDVYTARPAVLYRDYGKSYFSDNDMPNGVVRKSLRAAIIYLLKKLRYMEERERQRNKRRARPSTELDLLFIEPQNPASIHPVVDELTQRMAAALNDGTRTGCWKGVHRCVCGAESTNCNYLLSDGRVTNSLAVHYLAYHRDEVPKSELRKVRSLPEHGAEPTRRQLRGHGRMKVRARLKSVTRTPRVVIHRYVKRTPRHHG